MSTHDISRSIFDPLKRYSSVRMQQGRVVVDDDWNENERIENEERRRTRADLIGPSGTSDSGFSVSNARADEAGIEFEIGEGSYYLGGLRLETAAQRYRTQTDWLQLAAEDQTAVPDGDRTDLVYLECWEQSVTAIEDSELLEVALGVDTSGRMRVMKRIMVEPGVQAEDCADAWAEASKRWHTAGLRVDRETHEVLSGTTLGVAFSDEGASEDLCRPAVLGGYLGADNQALRVQLRDGGRFTWGFDNGADLHRVRIEERDGERKIVKLLTTPRDAAHWPRREQVVEILPWAAVLPNGQKIAATQGPISGIAEPYDPVSGTLTLRRALPPAFGRAWESRSDADHLREGAAGEEGEYLFMRVWSRGSEQGAADPEPAYVPDEPRELPGTGVRITFTGDAPLPGDYWTVALRPETRRTVVPWSLAGGRGADGLRRWRAPIALITWTRVGAALHASVHDCRRRFRPLTRLGTCCSYTVGDGSHSHGDFTSIQQAIDALPPGGGEVCVLPGVYDETIRIVRRRDVKVRGCGARTEIRADAPEDGAVVLVQGGRNISIESMAIVAGKGHCVAIEPVQRWPGHFLKPEYEYAVGMRVKGLRLSSGDGAAIAIDRARDVSMAENDIALDALAAAIDPAAESPAGKVPAVFVRGHGVVIEGNEIRANASKGFARTALGGLQIGGGSEEVEIRDNRIGGGNGNGITLGSVTYVSASGGEGGDFEIKRVRSWRETATKARWAGPYGRSSDGCLVIPEAPEPPAEDRVTPVADAPVRRVRIARNRIEDMAGDGIGVAMFFDTEAQQEVIAVSDVNISENQIARCYRWGRPAPRASMLYDVGHGGICLGYAEGLTIHRNEIAGNGTAHDRPTCGVFVLHAAGLTIDENRITANGRAAAVPGNQGGIVIGSASPDLRADGGIRGDEKKGSTDAWDKTALSAPSARVHHNVVVAPVGRALRLAGEGTFFVHGNAFTSQQPGIQLLDVRNFGAELKRAISSETELSGFDFVVAAVLVASWGAADASRFEEPEKDPSGRRAGTQRSVKATMAFHREGGMVEVPGVTPAFVAGLERLRGANVMFHDNQVTCLSPGKTPFLGVSTFVCALRGDASFVGNQLECRIENLTAARNAQVAGVTVRVQANRLDENLSERSLDRMISAESAANLLNHTTHNQSTHCLRCSCLLATGLLQTGNQILVNALGATCGREIKGRVRRGGVAIGGVLLSVRGTEATTISDPEGAFRLFAPVGDVWIDAVWGAAPRTATNVAAASGAVEIELREA